MNFIKIFEKCAVALPDKIALKFENKELDYQHLNRIINQFANYLKSNGISSADHIGVHLSRSLETVISILAVLKIGAVYIPLDPEYPLERIKFILEDAQVKAVITSKAEKLDDLKIKNIKIIETMYNVNDFADNNLDVNLSPSALAYIIYTSGSSGKPKGVKITHSNLFCFIENSSSRLKIDNSDVCLLSASTNYALSVRQIFIPLSFGAELVIANSVQIQDPGEFIALLKNENITQVDFVPSHFRSILYYLKNLKINVRENLLNNNLRRIVTVGEPLTSDLVKIWYDEFNQNCSIVNIFGQTETTGVICSYIVQKNRNYNGIIPIGKPIANTHVYILDKDLNPVKQGEEGELCVSNNSVGAGYLNLQELTEEKFLPNPFNQTTSDLLYRTGDLVKMGLDENIYYLGRKDSQIKVRGMRVDISEIEVVINEFPFVKESVVIPQKTNNDSTRLITYILSKEQNYDFNNMLKNWLRSRLPAHMIPSLFIKLDEFPKTPNGKIDRLKLAQYKLPDEQTDFPKAGLSETESKLLKIWERILKRKNINVDQDFFDLGGDSLSAVILFINVEKEFNKHLPVSVLYNYPTIRLLAQKVESIDNNIFKSLVQIKLNNSPFNLFFVHGAAGNILIYKDLAKYLDPQFNFYGLQSRGLHGDKEMQFKIEDMADSYLEEIKKVQTKGPYFLGGYCLGGTIALEIAQQLYKLGEEVKVVFLLETYNWNALPKRNKLDKACYSYQKILFHFKNLFLLKGKDKISFLDNKWKELMNRKNIWLGSLKNYLFEHSSAQNNFNRILAEVWEKNDIAAFNYKAADYYFEIIHIIPLKRYNIHNVQSADWNTLNPNLQSITLPIYPAGMLVEPFVKTLASKLNEILSQEKNVN
jgi:aspartate racemase